MEQPAVQMAAACYVGGTRGYRHAKRILQRRVVMVGRQATPVKIGRNAMYGVALLMRGGMVSGTPASVEGV